MLTKEQIEAIKQFEAEQEAQISERDKKNMFMPYIDDLL